MTWAAVLREMQVPSRHLGYPLWVYHLETSVYISIHQVGCISIEGYLPGQRSR